MKSKKHFLPICLVLTLIFPGAFHAHANLSPMFSNKIQIFLDGSRPLQEDTIYKMVDSAASYPGGISAWHKYLGKNLHYPIEAISNEIMGNVVVEFIVDKNGATHDFKVISGPAALRQESVRVVKESGNWNPAAKNGRPVSSYARETIKFVLQKG